MKKNILLTFILGVIVFLGVSFVTSNKAMSAGANMPTITTIGCTNEKQKFVYMLVNSNIPVKIQVGNFYITNPYFTRTLTGTSNKYLFIVDVTSKYNPLDPTYTYSMYNMTQPGVTDQSKLYFGNVNPNGLKCTVANTLLSTLGYTKVPVVVK